MTNRDDDAFSSGPAKGPLTMYLDDLKRLGFTGIREVLHVGCDSGHWITALAHLNRNVTAMDWDFSRLNEARRMLEAEGLANVRCTFSPIHQMPYADNRFDAVFCHGAPMLAAHDEALLEFSRVLKSGGRLYLRTGGRGWWLKIWLKNLLADGAVRAAAWRAFRNGRRATNVRGARRILGKGWKILAAAREGQINLTDEAVPLSQALPAKPRFSNHAVEFVARLKRKPPTPPPDPEWVWNRLQAKVAATLGRSRHELVTPLDEHPQPRPVEDLVNNHDGRIVGNAVWSALAVNRLALLHRLFHIITEGCASDLERVQRCQRFAQNHFFHHWAGQPMNRKGIMIQDPIALLLLGSARCGAIARCLADLLSCNGIPVRMLGLACHTTAEALVDGRWILADPSLYPPGIWPVGLSGEPLSFDQAMGNPRLLDAVPSLINQHHEYVEAFAIRYPEVFEKLEHNLRAPILPSSGYFGERFLAGRKGGVRFMKRGTPEDWNQDADFGWAFYDEEDIKLPTVPVCFRVEQVKAVRFDGEHLRWDRPFIGEGGGRVTYRLIVRRTPRPWSYQSLPVGCDFTVEGHVIATDEESFPSGEILKHGGFLTVIAGEPSWLESGVFHLPSIEFDLTRLAADHGITPPSASSSASRPSP